MTTREKYLAKPRTDFKTIAYNIARMLGLKCNMIHPKAVREYSTSRQLTYNEVILLVAAALAITAITTLASCSADDTAATTPLNQPIHEPIEVNIGSNLTVTRSTVENSAWTTGDKVVLVIKNNVVGDAGEITIHTYQAAANGNSVALNPVDLANTNFWQSTSETKQIVSAWSYGNSEVPVLTSNTITSFTLPTTQDGTKELLYSPGQTQTYNSTPASRAFSLIEEGGSKRQFFHQLAKVVFNVKGATETITAKMTIPGSGTITALETGDHNGTWSAGDDVSITPKTESTATGCIATYSAVVIPGVYNGKTLLEIIPVTGVEASRKSYKYIPTELTLKPGMCYTFTITVKNEIVLHEVTVASWTDDGTNSKEFILTYD